DELGFVHPSQFEQLNKGINEFSANFSIQLDENVFWFKDHKLAISVLALRPLYEAAKEAFMEARRTYDVAINLKGKFHEAAKCISLEPENNSTTDSDVHLLEGKMMRHSKALLLLSCDFATAWNSRKQILLGRQNFSLIIEEFNLSALVLSYSPKSEQAWNHRRWLVKLVGERFQNLQDMLQKESELVERICEKSKMNYRAWCYRGWLVPYKKKEQCSSYSKAYCNASFSWVLPMFDSIYMEIAFGSKSVHLFAKVLNELDHTRKWAELHVADNSCFHYRRILLLRLMMEDKVHQKKCSVDGAYGNSDFHSTWKAELDWNMMLINLYSGRENVQVWFLWWSQALWVHRRFLTCQWITHCGNQSNKVHAFLKDELQLVHACLNISDSGFGDHRAQGAHAASYFLYIFKSVPRSEQADLQEKLGKLPDLSVLLNEVWPERSELWKDLLLSKFIAADV
ncbi:prenyltransferase alpha subunit repeat-containing protein 1, partial [Nymphaea thermarum]